MIKSRLDLELKLLQLLVKIIFNIHIDLQSINFNIANNNFNYNLFRIKLNQDYWEYTE